MIRIGANPIGWSNDDLLEIGGDIPLETCLSEARTAGFTGMELGHKFPRERRRAEGRRSTPFGMALVSGWYSTELLIRDVAAEMKHREGRMLDLLQGDGLHRSDLRRNLERHPWRPLRPLSATPVHGEGRLGAVRRALHQLRRAH
jgi:hypothetical protein